MSQIVFLNPTTQQPIRYITTNSAYVSGSQTVRSIGRQYIDSIREIGYRDVESSDYNLVGSAEVSYDVVLNRQPTEDISFNFETIQVQENIDYLSNYADIDNLEVDLPEGGLAFTTDNWNTPQTITIRLRDRTAIDASNYAIEQLEFRVTPQDSTPGYGNGFALLTLNVYEITETV